MRLEFSVSGLKPSQRRRREPERRQPSIAPVVQTIVLAYQIEHAVQDGRAGDYADVARQLGLTRARVSQIMRLLQLPAACLETLVLDDRVSVAKLTERHLRPIVRIAEPSHQMEHLERLISDQHQRCES